MSGRTLQCEFGERWSDAKVADLLARASTIRDANERMLFIVKRFVVENTPFLKESYLPPLESNTLRIRFAQLRLHHVHLLHERVERGEHVRGIRRRPLPHPL